MWRLREPERGGKGVLASDKGAASTGSAGAADEDATQTTDAQRLARERGLVPDPELVDRPGRSAAHEPLCAPPATCCACARTSSSSLASACGYYFLAGLQTFGLEFSKEQYGIDQPLASTLLLVVGVGSLAGVLPAARSATGC